MCHYIHTLGVSGTGQSHASVKRWMQLPVRKPYSEEDISYYQTKQYNDYNYEVYWG